MALELLMLIADSSTSDSNSADMVTSPVIRIMAIKELTAIFRKYDRKQNKER